MAKRDRTAGSDPGHGSEPDRVATVEVAFCAPCDRPEQVRLFNQCFKKAVDVAALTWRYDENPCGTAISALSRPTGADGVSGYACSPRVALAFGDDASRATVGETGDVMTHPDWRKRGLFSALDRACMQESARRGWPLVFGLPNRRSAHIFLELGWQGIGTLRPWTFLLRSDGHARALRAGEGRLAAWLAPLSARRCARARRRLVSAMSAQVERRELTAFPPEVEALSRVVEKRFAFMVRRDARYLDWRFLKSPSRLHRAFGLFAKSGALAGYVVVQLPRPGETLGYLVDLLADDPAVVAAAIETALAVLEASGASAVRATAIDGSWWKGRLEEAGFLPPKAENHLKVILWTNDAGHALSTSARDAARWYLTDGDRDDETMG